MHIPKSHWAGMIRICIDSYDSGIPAGRLYSPRLGEAESFRGLIGLLMAVEQFLAIEDIPQSFSAVRTFRPVLNPLPDPAAITAPRVGELATLELGVLFRQNASWQGALRWIEGKEEQRFRSVLELIWLLDSALGGRELSRSNEYPA